MSTVISISTRRRYGVVRACRVWDVARAGLYRGRKATVMPSAPRRRPGPQGPMPDTALVEAIRQVLIASPFHGEGYRKVWARLRHAGLLSSKERVRRLMRENGLQATTRTGSPRGPRNHDGTIIPETIDTMWGTDMTTTFTAEQGQVAVFVAVDHCSAECVGLHAALRGTRHEALEPVRQGVVERLGGVKKDAAQGLSIRHDHGSQYMSRDFQKEIAWLGAASSPAFFHRRSAARTTEARAGEETVGPSPWRGHCPIRASAGPGSARSWPSSPSAATWRVCAPKVWSQDDIARAKPLLSVVYGIVSDYSG